MVVATTTAIALALAAASAGAQYYNTQQTAHRQDNAAADQIRQQSLRQQEANSQVNQLTSKIAESSPTVATDVANKQYTQALKATAAEAENSVPTVSGASDTYKEDAKNASMGIDKYGSKIAGLMSRIDAPANQRQQEGFMTGDTAANLQRIGSFAQGDDFLAKLRLNAIRRNAGLDAFSTVAGAYSNSMGRGAPSSTALSGGYDFGNMMGTGSGNGPGYTTNLLGGG